MEEEQWMKVDARGGPMDEGGGERVVDKEERRKELKGRRNEDESKGKRDDK